MSTEKEARDLREGRFVPAQEPLPLADQIKKAAVEGERVLGESPLSRDRNSATQYNPTRTPSSSLPDRDAHFRAGLAPSSSVKRGSERRFARDERGRLRPLDANEQLRGGETEEFA